MQLLPPQCLRRGHASTVPCAARARGHAHADMKDGTVAAAFGLGGGVRSFRSRQPLEVGGFHCMCCGEK